MSALGAWCCLNDCGTHRWISVTPCNLVMSTHDLATCFWGVDHNLYIIVFNRGYSFECKQLGVADKGKNPDFDLQDSQSHRLCLLCGLSCQPMWLGESQLTWPKMSRRGDLWGELPSVCCRQRVAIFCKSFLIKVYPISKIPVKFTEQCNAAVFHVTLVKTVSLTALNLTES